MNQIISSNMNDFGKISLDRLDDPISDSILKNCFHVSELWNAKIMRKLQTENRISWVLRLAEWKNGLIYRSPHLFRKGHVHYGQEHSRTQDEYKAVSQNVMHFTTGVTDQFYSNMDDEEKKIKIDSKDQTKTESR